MSARINVWLAAILITSAQAAYAVTPVSGPAPGTTSLSLGLQAGDATHPFVSDFQNNLPTGNYSQTLAVGTTLSFASINGLDLPTPHLDALASMSMTAPGGGIASAQGYTDYSFMVFGSGDAPVTINASGSVGISPFSLAQADASLRFRVAAASSELVFDQSLGVSGNAAGCNSNFGALVNCTQSFTVNNDFLLHTNTLYNVHMDAMAGLLFGTNSNSLLTASAFANLDPTFTVHGPFTIQLSDGFGGGINLPFSTGAVPEPASWALMILGFGLVGFAMRQRPKVSANVRFA